MPGQHGARLRNQNRAAPVVGAEVHQVHDWRQLFSSGGGREVRRFIISHLIYNLFEWKISLKVCKFRWDIMGGDRKVRVWQGGSRPPRTIRRYDARAATSSLLHSNYTGTYLSFFSKKGS